MTTLSNTVHINLTGTTARVLPRLSSQNSKALKVAADLLILSGRVVICGAGIIGSAIAYYLSLKGVRSLLIERSGVACAASGKLLCSNLESLLEFLLTPPLSFMLQWHRRCENQS